MVFYLLEKAGMGILWAAYPCGSTKYFFFFLISRARLLGVQLDGWYFGVLRRRHAVLLGGARTGAHVPHATLVHFSCFISVILLFMYAPRGSDRAGLVRHRFALANLGYNSLALHLQLLEREKKRRMQRRDRHGRY